MGPGGAGGPHHLVVMQCMVVRDSVGTSVQNHDRAPCLANPVGGLPLKQVVPGEKKASNMYSPRLDGHRDPGGVTKGRG